MQEEESAGDVGVIGYIDMTNLLSVEAQTR